MMLIDDATLQLVAEWPTTKLLQVNASRGQILFGNDVFSSWEAIRGWS
jgi:hypothetical protein